MCVCACSPRSNATTTQKERNEMCIKKICSTSVNLYFSAVHTLPNLATVEEHTIWHGTQYHQKKKMDFDDMSFKNWNSPKRNDFFQLLIQLLVDKYMCANILGSIKRKWCVRLIKISFFGVVCRLQKDRKNAWAFFFKEKNVLQEAWAPFYNISNQADDDNGQSGHTLTRRKWLLLLFTNQ